MKPFIILSRRFLALIFLLLILFLLIIFQFLSSAMTNRNGDTHNKRIDFINNLGYTVNEETVTDKQIIIPYDFSSVYSNYNELQIKAGYDLKDYKGKSVTRYCYEVLNLKNENYNINLLVFDGMIIGGDICSVNINGEILPLSSNK